jgi:hypothetical protein
MRQEVRVAFQNALMVVMDPTVGEPPEFLGGRLVAATASCVVVGTLAPMDGETLVTITTSATQHAPDGKLVFEGVIEAPNGTLAVCTVTGESLISADVPRPRVRIQIWANDASEPDVIHVVVG